MQHIAKSVLQYFETSFEEPITDWGRVKELWDAVPDNQNDVTWWHEILVEESYKSLAHVKITRTMQPSGE